MSSPIEDYALIGDGETAALVNRDGSIDWLCWPRFDDDACFAALLGTEGNGRWLIAPDCAVISRARRYQADTLIIEQEVTTEHGSIRTIDFMPIRGAVPSLVRIVEGLSGAVPMQLDLRLRFDYGALPPWGEVNETGFSARVGPNRVTLHADVPITVADHDAKACFTVREGERLAFVLGYAPSTHPPTPPLDVDRALVETQGYWRGWIGAFDDGKTRWPTVVRRSLITLKAMAHRETGGLVAAPTAGLPEMSAGSMNWDYRYCWLRDATFTLGAFCNAGFLEEATAWRDWLLRAVAGSPDKMRIMYRVDGSRHLSEWTVDALPGYRDARPVRIGNAASTQHQIDVYGEVLDCLSFARRAGIAVTDHHRLVERLITEHLETVWHTRGSGVWESRAEPKQYTYSKAMAWAGFDRALKDEEAFGTLDDRRRAQLERLRQKVHADVIREGFNVGLNTFTQSYGSHVLDASLLILPLVGFLPANDPRMAATIARIGTELNEGGLIRRKALKADGPNEGAFLACSCWMADCLNMQGRHDEAVAQFERVLAVANDVGLLAEEYDVPARCLTGNFPQALTHLAVVNTALGLSGPVLNRGA